MRPIALTCVRTTVCAAIIAALVASSPAAQDKPDFSGSWVLEAPSEPAPEIPRALSVRQPLVRTNVRGEPMKPVFAEIAVERNFESGVRSEAYQIGIEGGSVPGRREDGSLAGPRTYHAVRWEDNALVFESGSYTRTAPGTGVWGERREVWSLEPNRRLRIAITTSSSAEATRTVMLVYRQR